MVKRVAMVVGLLLVLGPPLLAGRASPAAAAPTGANEAVERCRDEALLELRGITRGECVNLAKLLPSDNATSEIAALCSIASIQQVAGATNKGECIQVLRMFR
jgi:hypothetical protein